MNPASRGGRSKGYFELIHKLLDGVDYDYEYTENLDHAANLSRRANDGGYDVVVAVGGDGTINRVLNGFYDHNGKVSQAKLGVIYTGTSPDFCKNYGIPLQTNQAVDVLKKGAVKRIGIGRAEFKSCVRYFACCLNVGLGASTATNANSGIRKKFGDKLGTFLSLFKTLMTYKPIDIVVNGEKLTNVYNLTVGKTYYLASGLKVKNNLREDDDRFYLLLMQNFKLSVLYKMYMGMDIDISYAERIEIEGEGLVDFDGDAATSFSTLPCRISAAEKLQIITVE